jgi:hypothetical protein
VRIPGNCEVESGAESEGCEVLRMGTTRSKWLDDRSWIEVGLDQIG